MKKFENCLICTDIDGTLLNSAKALDAPSAAAIRMFMAEGGRFTFATGRVAASFEIVRKKLLWNAPVVFANGAQIYDYASERLLWEQPMDSSFFGYLTELVNAYEGVCLEVYGHLHCEALHLNEISRNHGLKFGFSIREVQRFSDIPGTVVKTLFTGPRPTLEVLQARIRREQPALHAVFSASLLLEVFPCTVDKGAGAKRLAAMLSSAPVKLFTAGDQENDLDLLAAATVSFAPENAVAAVKKKADVLLPDNDHNTMAALIDYIGGHCL